MESLFSTNSQNTAPQARNAFEQLEANLLHPQRDKRQWSADKQFDFIMGKVADIDGAVVSPGELKSRLQASHRSANPLRIKFGIDPTGPDVHIGHAVSLLNLRRLHEMGHKIILVIGDFTGMIGDPSGRTDARPALSEEEVRANMATYEEQASRIIDLSDPSIERHYNSAWMLKLDLRQWAAILKRIPVASLLQREDFRKRLAAGRGLSVAELEYALFMGYDSLVLNPDIELGGVDQYLNMHVCRQMMSIVGQEPETIISYNLLPGTSGELDEEGRYAKMSKSRGNYIPITASAAEMYGKTMSIPDEIMWIWYRELTEITPRELEALRSDVNSGQVHPKLAKKLLARAVVGAFYHFEEKIISDAEKDFDEKFGASAILVPDTTQSIQVDASRSILEILSAITGRSKSDIRRLVEQAGVHVLCGKKYEPLLPEELSDSANKLHDAVIRIGKRQYFRLLA
jgi:tyrosyl-tRNA synthetase